MSELRDALNILKKTAERSKVSTAEELGNSVETVALLWAIMFPVPG